MVDIRLPARYEIYNPQADRAVRFINSLTHTKGKFARKPFEMRDWQEYRIVRPIFGQVDENGKRLINTALIGLPRKNGKSEICATFALKGLVADGEWGAEVYSAASDRDQASLVFNVAKFMVLNDPVLSERCKIVDSKKEIHYPLTGSFYKAISADADTKHGFNASMIIYDELHTARNRELWDVLVTSMSTREQPLAVAITTAGWDRETICWELWKYGEDVSAGLFPDPGFFSVIYSAPDDADWLDREVWHAVNPALGDFRRLDEMETLAMRAQRVPAQQNTFRRLYLNQWTQQATRWLDPDEWKACQEDFTAEELRGQPCYVGVDLSNTTDITAVVLVFPQPGGTYKVLPFFWVPADDMRERQNRDVAGYMSWIQMGHLRGTPGNVIDQDAIEEAIKKEFGTQFNIKEIAIDRWNATGVMTHLQGAGFTVVPFGQGYASMTAPSKELETLILSRKIKHNGNAVLNWMIGNVAAEQDAAGNIKPSKAKSTKRIDGVVALIMALGRAIVRGTGASIYDERGLLSI